MVPIERFSAKGAVFILAWGIARHRARKRYPHAIQR